MSSDPIQLPESPIAAEPASSLQAQFPSITPISMIPPMPEADSTKKQKQKRLRRSIGAQELPEWLKDQPPGWRAETRLRKNGTTAGHIDTFYYSPEGHQFRTKRDAQHFIDTGERKSRFKKPKIEGKKNDVPVESFGSSCIDSNNPPEELNKDSKDPPNAMVPDSYITRESVGPECNNPPEEADLKDPPNNMVPADSYVKPECKNPSGEVSTKSKAPPNEMGNSSNDCNPSATNPNTEIPSHMLTNPLSTPVPEPSLKAHILDEPEHTLPSCSAPILCPSPTSMIPMDESESTPVFVSPKKVQHREVGPQELPEWLQERPGWRVETTARKSGKTARRMDTFYYSPDGHKFRSKKETMHFLETGEPRESNQKPVKKKLKKNPGTVESSGSSCLVSNNPLEENNTEAEDHPKSMVPNSDVKPECVEPKCNKPPEEVNTHSKDPPNNMTNSSNGCNRSTTNPSTEIPYNKVLDSESILESSLKSHNLDVPAETLPTPRYLCPSPIKMIPYGESIPVLVSPKKWQRRQVGPQELPKWLLERPGWRVETTDRKGGKTAGKGAKFYCSPDGRQFKTKKEVLHFIETGELLQKHQESRSKEMKTTAVEPENNSVQGNGGGERGGKDPV